MRKPVKPLVLITISFLLLSSVKGQLLSKNNDGFARDLKMIVTDYSMHFQQYKGDLISSNPQSADYACLLKVSGAEESIITTYSARKLTESWQGTFLTTESFEEAKKKFRSLFNQLNGLSIEQGSAKLRLKGNYEMPDAGKKFNSIIFSTPEENEQLRVELELQFSAPMQWKVKVLVYGKEREDEERGRKEE